MVRGSPLSVDLRKAILNLSESGQSGCQIAKSLNISRYTIRNIIKIHKETGIVEPKTRSGSKPKATKLDLRALRKIAKDNRRNNCMELALLWSDSAGKKFSRSTTNRSLKKIGFGFYKVS